MGTRIEQDSKLLTMPRPQPPPQKMLFSDASTWKQMFQELIQEEKPKAKWTLQLDKNILPNGMAQGWRQYQQTGIGRFLCSICDRYWVSAQVKILCHLYREPGKSQGQVLMRIFGQSNTAQVPIFPTNELQFFFTHELQFFTKEPEFFPTKEPQFFPTKEPQFFPTNELQFFPTNELQLFFTNELQFFPTNEQQFFTKEPQFFPTKEPQFFPTKEPQFFFTNELRFFTKEPQFFPTKEPQFFPTKELQFFTSDFEYNF
ncbi:hypothetical protein NN561_014277 [Cricetulus griseus]